ncbi:sn-glycerol-3-phosphate ABC transporter ATP-binding protein UgpC [Kiritimatiellota bacterium B12222]|nr:sn-glycerol-3-phosphate ABC transporter ATP-binding protein UgpC [Kiritimatiellota bacterium B12222]
MSEVILQNVFKVYPGDVTAVRDFSLEIKDKEFMVFVGPSGCGKSTTLRMIAGLEEISKGTINIGGRIVNDVPPKDRDIAMVFQNYALYPHMTVYKNMAFGLKLRKMPRAEIDKRVREAAAILGIEELLERKPKALSGGQRQRVAVGRAIVRQPKAFLFDEPLSNLDAKMRVQMRMEISKLHNQLQSTMIYVTHDQVEAMTMGDRIVVMKDGIMQQVDTPLEIYSNPKNRFVAGFIGSPPMNFFDGELAQGANGLVFKNDAMEVKVHEKHVSALTNAGTKKVTMGIRPENLQDSVLVSNPDPETLVKSKVEVVEPMGAEIMLYLSVGDNAFIARVDGKDKAKSGHEISMSFDMVHASYFEPGELGPRII